MFTVTQQIDGMWVVWQHETIVFKADTSGEAWRWVDQKSGDPISPAEKRSAFVADKILNGE